MPFGKKPAAILRGGLNQCFFIAKIVISIIIIGRAGIIACSVAAVNIIQSVKISCANRSICLNYSDNSALEAKRRTDSIADTTLSTLSYVSPVQITDFCTLCSL